MNERYVARIREPTRFKVVIREEKRFTAHIADRLMFMYLGGRIMSQAEYDSLPVKDPNTYYFIMG